MLCRIRRALFCGAEWALLGISGAIAAAVENATDTKVTVFGKPEVAGLEMIADTLGIRPEEMMVIGDDPKLEIRMGRRAGAFCVGVTTGICDGEGFQAFPKNERAHVVYDTLNELLAAECFRAL